jgi:hypothetical protein
VADWYRASILSALWEFPAERFTSQAFWDAFEQILPEGQEALSPSDDPLEQAQLRLLGQWKEKQLVSRRLLAYDTTNFYTYIASTNTRNQLAQRGHNKQGRHNLRQVGLSYVLDGENGLSLCHHVYPGNVADVEEFSTALARITRLLDQNQIGRETVTLVLDKGSAALANTVALEEAGLGWISALPWNQAPAELRSRAVEELPLCSSAQPGVRAAAETMLVHGREYRCVVKYSASFAGEQLHSLTTSLSRVLQSLRRLAQELNKPKAHWKHDQIVRKIRRWLSAPFLAELIRYQLKEHDRGWRLQFDFDSAAFQQLLNQRLGRTVLLTNRLDWSAEHECSADSRMETGWVGIPCFTGPIARFVSMPSIVCWASPCCSMCTSKPKPAGPICPSSNCSRNWSRSNSSFYFIPRRARRVHRALLMCSPNRLWRSRLW